MLEGAFHMPWDEVLATAFLVVVMGPAFFAGLWVIGGALLQEWRRRPLKSIAPGSYKVFATERVAKDSEPYWRIYVTPEGKDLWKARYYDLPVARVELRDVQPERLGLVKTKLEVVKRGRLTEVVLSPSNT